MIYIDLRFSYKISSLLWFNVRMNEVLQASETTQSLPEALALLYQVRWCGNGIEWYRRYRYGHGGKESRAAPRHACPCRSLAEESGASRKPWNENITSSQGHELQNVMRTSSQAITDRTCWQCGPESEPTSATHHTFHFPGLRVRAGPANPIVGIASVASMLRLQQYMALASSLVLLRVKSPAKTTFASHLQPPCVPQSRSGCFWKLYMSSAQWNSDAKSHGLHFWSFLIIFEKCALAKASHMTAVVHAVALKPSPQCSCFNTILCGRSGLANQRQIPQALCSSLALQGVNGFNESSCCPRPGGSARGARRG